MGRIETQESRATCEIMADGALFGKGTRGALSLAPVHSDRVERLLLVGKIVVHAGHPEVMLILNADTPFCRFHLILSVED